MKALDETCSQFVGHGESVLFTRDHLPFHVLVVVRSATCRTQTVQVIFEIVKTELAYLQSSMLEDNSRVEQQSRSYLITTRTRSEVSIREIKFLDT